MAEATKKKEGRFSKWWKGVKAEFSRIIWLDRPTVIKQTAIVVIVTVILGIIIGIVDNICQFGLGFLIG